MFLLLGVFFSLARVPSGSMEPTLPTKCYFFGLRLPYLIGDPLPVRGDVIMFRSDEYDELMVKRVIGLPGETVCIQDGKIYIDGEVLEENYGYYLEGKVMEGYDFSEPVEVGEDEYFVLGDNRNDSLDSRKIGCIPKTDIIGRAVFRIYPFQNIGTLE